MLEALKGSKFNPGSIADTDTKNASFIAMAQELKEKGVKNYDFMLLLLDPSLKGIDPYDPNLSPEMQARVTLECSKNPFYFFREVLRPTSLSFLQDVPFELNRGNMRAIWAWLAGLSVYWEQSQNTGQLLATYAIGAWQGMIYHNEHIVLMDKDKYNLGVAINQYHSLYNSLPLYLNPLDLTSNEFKDIDAREVKLAKERGTKFSFVPAVADVRQAYNLGCGITTSTIFINNLAQLTHNRVVVPALMAASYAAAVEARNKDQPAGCFITSKPGYLNTPEGKYAHSLRLMFTDWGDHFFDCVSKDELLTGAGDAFVIVAYNYKQLGKTDEWLRVVLGARNIPLDSDEARMDFFNEWVSP